MKKAVFLSLVASGFLIACNRQVDETPTGGTVYLDLPAAPYDYFGNNESNYKATLGRVLFYEKRLSLNNATACASCHKQEFAFADNVAFSRGFDNRVTKRNSMPIQNILNGFGGGGFTGGPVFGGGSTFFWDGRETKLEELAARPITNHVEMGIEKMSDLAPKLSRLPYYKDLFVKAYGDEEITPQRISESLMFFMTAITSNNSKFDKAMSGFTQQQLTPLEAQGMQLFNTKYECNGCHKPFGGYTGTPTDFMNIGLEYPNTDEGAGPVFRDPTMNGKFKVPALRNVAVTAPYMHDGRFATLEEVLGHYSENIQDDPNLDHRLRDANGDPMRMQISDQEKKALIAFLNTMTDHTMLTDVRYSNPFKVK